MYKKKKISSPKVSPIFLSSPLIPYLPNQDNKKPRSPWMTPLIAKLLDGSILT